MLSLVSVLVAYLSNSLGNYCKSKGETYTLDKLGAKKSRFILGPPAAVLVGLLEEGGRDEINLLGLGRPDNMSLSCLCRSPTFQDPGGGSDDSCGDGRYRAGVGVYLGPLWR